MVDNAHIFKPRSRGCGSRPFSPQKNGSHRWGFDEDSSWESHWKPSVSGHHTIPGPQGTWDQWQIHRFSRFHPDFGQKLNVGHFAQLLFDAIWCSLPISLSWFPMVSYHLQVRLRFCSMTRSVTKHVAESGVDRGEDLPERFFQLQKADLAKCDLLIVGLPGGMACDWASTRFWNLQLGNPGGASCSRCFKFGFTYALFFMSVLLWFARWFNVLPIYLINYASGVWRSCDAHNIARKNTLCHHIICGANCWHCVFRTQCWNATFHKPIEIFRRSQGRKCLTLWLRECCFSNLSYIPHLHIWPWHQGFLPKVDLHLREKGEKWQCGKPM